jgi:transposase
MKSHAEMGEGLIHLSLDSYSASQMNAIRETAASLGITLYFIPPGLTDEFQPLDWIVFRVLKSHAKRLFHERFRANPYQRRTKMDAVVHMLTA